MRIAAALVLAALVLATGAARAGVFRCTEGDGSITYQDTACTGSAAEKVTNIPTQFPPPNEAERARLLQREAELEQRLEARRERESREAMMRMASAPAPAPVAQPDYTDVYPLYFPVARPRYPMHFQHGSNRPHAPRVTPYRP